MAGEGISAHSVTRRPLPFADPSLARLTAAERAAMARHWQRRAWSEGQVATAFCELHASLLAVGAAAPVVALVERAVTDELRHSDVCTALAGAYLGAPVAAPVVVADGLPRFVDVDRATEVTLQVVGMCCVSETLATVWLEASLAASRTPLARAANRLHLAEELGHARAGWAHLGSGLPASQLAAVQRHLLEFVQVAVEDWLAAGADLPVGTGLADHGVLSADEHRAAILRGARDVVVPGFGRAGLAVELLSAWLRDQG